MVVEQKWASLTLRAMLAGSSDSNRFNHAGFFHRVETKKKQLLFSQVTVGGGQQANHPFPYNKT